MCKFFEREIIMETIGNQSEITGIWRLENVSGLICARLRNGNLISLGKLFSTGKLGATKKFTANKLLGCGFRWKHKMYVSCTRLAEKSLQVEFNNAPFEVKHEFILTPGEKCVIIEEGVRLSKKTLTEVQYESFDRQWIQLGEALKLQPQIHAPHVRYVFVAKKVVPTPKTLEVRPRRAVTLYNNGEHLYVKLPDGNLFHLLFRLTSKPVLCTSIAGCNFSEKGIVLKHLGHTMSGDAIVMFFDQSSSHNWNLTVSVRKNQMIGVDDLRDAMGVIQVTG
jgi:hypothetical protein